MDYVTAVKILKQVDAEKEQQNLSFKKQPRPTYNEKKSGIVINPPESKKFQLTIGSVKNAVEWMEKLRLLIAALVYRKVELKTVIFSGRLYAEPWSYKDFKSYISKKYVEDFKKCMEEATKKQTASSSSSSSSALIVKEQVALLSPIPNVNESVHYASSSSSATPMVVDDLNEEVNHSRSILSPNPKKRLAEESLNLSENTQEDRRGINNQQSNKRPRTRSSSSSVSQHVESEELLKLQASPKLTPKISKNLMHEEEYKSPNFVAIQPQNTANTLEVAVTVTPAPVLDLSDEDVENLNNLFDGWESLGLDRFSMEKFHKRWVVEKGFLVGTNGRGWTSFLQNQLKKVEKYASLIDKHLKPLSYDVDLIKEQFEPAEKYLKQIKQILDKLPSDQRGIKWQSYQKKFQVAQTFLNERWLDSKKGFSSLFNSTNNNETFAQVLEKLEKATAEEIAKTKAVAAPPPQIQYVQAAPPVAAAPAPNSSYKEIINAMPAATEITEAKKIALPSKKSSEETSAPPVRPPAMASLFGEMGAKLQKRGKVETAVSKNTITPFTLLETIFKKITLQRNEISNDLAKKSELAALEAVKITIEDLQFLPDFRSKLPSLKKLESDTKVDSSAPLLLLEAMSDQKRVFFSADLNYDDLAVGVNISSILSSGDETETTPIIRKTQAVPPAHIESAEVAQQRLSFLQFPPL